MATTWNPSDKTANVALTGGNLVATQTASVANGGVRGAASRLSGKYYWEYTFNIVTDITSGVGVITRSAALNLAFNAAPAAILSRGGTIYVNTNIVRTGSAIANGSIIGIALDLDTGLIWFRVTSSGLWNYSATANPATGVGGIASGFGRVTAAYPHVFVGTQNDQITANFGDSAFNGSVPVGFTSGFPVGIATLVGAVTQTSLEQWSQGAPVAQVTQIALEQWGALSVGAGQAVVTQVGLEQWTAVAATTTTTVAEQYAVTVIT